MKGLRCFPISCSAIANTFRLQRGIRMATSLFPTLTAYPSESEPADQQDARDQCKPEKRHGDQVKPQEDAFHGRQSHRNEIRERSDTPPKAADADPVSQRLPM